MVSRGEIWWADLGDPVGSAPGLRRPVLVVSADAFNASTIRTVIVVVVTTTMRLAALPGNVALPADVSGLPKDSVANVSQLATISTTALECRVSALPPWVLSQVDFGVLARAG
jgi:mRNA interferase MazF